MASPAAIDAAVAKACGVSARQARRWRGQGCPADPAAAQRWAAARGLGAWRADGGSAYRPDPPPLLPLPDDRPELTPEADALLELATRTLEREAAADDGSDPWAPARRQALAALADDLELSGAQAAQDALCAALRVRGVLRAGEDAAAALTRLTGQQAVPEPPPPPLPPPEPPRPPRTVHPALRPPVAAKVKGPPPPAPKREEPPAPASPYTLPRTQPSPGVLERARLRRLETRRTQHGWRPFA